jgi:ATP-binding cassette subfamily F protein uup
MALVTLREVSLGFHGPLVLDAVDLTVEPGERVCVLGRNGTGKSTLLRLIHGEIAVDRGEVARQQGLVTALLPQDVPRDLRGDVFDEVARGTGPRADLLAEYHHVASRLAVEASDQLRTRLGSIQAALELGDGWKIHQDVQTVISRMGLDADADVGILSAGMKRRVLLAKALVRRPDLLLLDEPTNHLDIDAIGWLEEFLLRYGGTFLFVTHDRVFVSYLCRVIL